MLKGKKVFLRRLDEHDLERTLVWANDTEMFVMMGIFGPRTRKAQEQWYESIYDSRTNLVFAVCRLDNQEHIGNVSLFDIDYRNRNAGLTIMLPDHGCRGKGYGTDAVLLICDYAFDYLNLHKIHCRTDNPIAAKLYKSIGFVQEGTLRQQAYYFGKYIDKLIFGLLRKEYKSCKTKDPELR